MMGDAKGLPILRDKLELWRGASVEGSMEMRDYHRRAALELEAVIEAIEHYADESNWSRVVVPSRGSHAEYDIEDDYYRWNDTEKPSAVALRALSPAAQRASKEGREDGI